MENQVYCRYTVENGNSRNTLPRTAESSGAGELGRIALVKSCSLEISSTVAWDTVADGWVTVAGRSFDSSTTKLSMVGISARNSGAPVPLDDTVHKNNSMYMYVIFIQCYNKNKTSQTRYIGNFR